MKSDLHRFPSFSTMIWSINLAKHFKFAYGNCGFMGLRVIFTFSVDAISEIY